MGFIQTIIDILESIFNRNSPEVQKKMQLKKLENDIKLFQPVIYKGGNLLPNFAEAARILYVNTSALLDIFSQTIGASDVTRCQRFEAQLVLTGLNTELQNMVESLSYEKRVDELKNENFTTSQIFDKQHKRLEKILHELHTDQFKKIDMNLISLHQLSDLCKYNFVTILQLFDVKWENTPGYTPSYQELSIERLTSVLEDLYYQVYGLKITQSVVNAILALAKLILRNNFTEEKQKEITQNVKLIAYVLNHIFTQDKLKSLIQYARRDIAYAPKFVTYRESATANLEQMLSSKFRADEERIKTEMKDANIHSEINDLFGDSQLAIITGYNNEFNSKLVNNGTQTFIWILPMQILKTFLKIYMTDKVKSLLNDIVIEGFFNNSNYKTEFSQDVYAALECENELGNFETSFNKGGDFSTLLLDGYLRDGHNDPDFFKKLDQTVTNINNEASRIIAKQTNCINKLYKHIVDLIQDAKKPHCEICSNLKVLMLSSRNKENTDLLEMQYPKWDNFFKIMKNYAIITS